jgi:hypothetical protein
MAANDPGLAIAAAPGDDTLKGAIVKDSATPAVTKSPIASEEDDQEQKVVAPDQFDARFETSRNEIWAYYSYYIGNNGLSLFNFAPTAAQNLLYQYAEFIGGADNKIVFFAGTDRSINSVILLCNGISFAIQAVLFLLIGAFADFGNFRPNILIALSIVAWGIGFGWLGVHEESQWQYGLGLYIVGLIAYQLCLTYWTAAFPGLARNTPELRAMAEKYEAGEITREDYDREDSLKRNELSNVAFYVQSVAELVILAVIVGIMFGLDVNASVEKNNYGLSVLIAFASAVWILVAIPWFVLEKRRPGQDPGRNIVVAGLWQLGNAMTQVWQLRQSLFYLIGESPRCTNFDLVEKALTRRLQDTFSWATPLTPPSPSLEHYRAKSLHITPCSSHISSLSASLRRLWASGHSGTSRNATSCPPRRCSTWSLSELLCSMAGV